MTLFLLGSFTTSATTPMLDTKEKSVALKKESFEVFSSNVFTIKNDAVDVARIAVSENVKNDTSYEKAVIKCIKKRPIRTFDGYSGWQVYACVDVDGTTVSVQGQYYSWGSEINVLAEVDSTCKCN